MKYICRECSCRKQIWQHDDCGITLGLCHCTYHPTKYSFVFLYAKQVHFHQNKLFFSFSFLYKMLIVMMLLLLMHLHMFYFSCMQDKERRGKQAPSTSLLRIYEFSMQIPNGNTWLQHILLEDFLCAVMVFSLECGYLLKGFLSWLLIFEQTFTFRKIFFHLLGGTFKV